MSKPYTILYPHSSDELYGSDLVLLNLVRRLDRNVFRPYVLLPTDIPYEGALSAELSKADVEYTSLAMPVLRRRYFSINQGPKFLGSLLPGVRGVMAIARKEEAALFHSNTSAVWGGALAAARLQIPHVWHVHELVTNPAQVRRLMAWMVNRYSTHVVAISHAVADHLLADVPQLKDRLSVIYDAVDTERFSPQVSGDALRQTWGVGPEDVLIGVVGRISAWKGQDFFLRAFARAAQAFPRMKGVIVGGAAPGEEWRIQQLQSLAGELGVAGQIVWAGYRTDAPQVMAAIDILALPSIRPEPFGMVVIEAMASGNPVVATAHGGPLESVLDGETGSLVSPDDPTEMATALARLAGDPALRSVWGANGRRRAEDVFGFQRHVRAFQDLYLSLIEENGDRSGR